MVIKIIGKCSICEKLILLESDNKHKWKPKDKLFCAECIVRHNIKDVDSKVD